MFTKLTILACVLLFSCVSAQYKIEGFYSSTDTDCSGLYIRESYIQSKDCVPLSCSYNATYRSYLKVTCVTDLPKEPGTLALASFADDNCTGNPTSVGLYNLNQCLPNSRASIGQNLTYGFFTCDGTYLCNTSDCAVAKCSFQPIVTQCADHPTAGSTIYECYPAVTPTVTPNSTTTTTTSSTTGSTTTTSVSSSVVSSLFFVVVLAAALIVA